MHDQQLQRWPLIAWGCVSAVMAGAAGAMVIYSEQFSWQLSLIEIPAVPLAACSALIGIVFISLAWLIPWSIKSGINQPRLLAFMLAFGLCLRLAMLITTPALEDDFYRYLWDGGVVSAGFNPYARSPDAVFEVTAPERLQQLAAESSPVIERVNHPHLKTIYPAVAQFWFAVSHKLQPWSLLAWRIVGIGAEIATMTLLLMLLAASGRSLLWSALYWWNPLVVKELINSAHMEFVLLPIILLALYLAVQRRYVSGTIALAFAVGTKLWPIMLLPLMLRPLLTRPVQFTIAFLSFSLLILVWAIAPIVGGVDESSGFIAFAKHWQTNSALFQNTNAFAQLLLDGAGLNQEEIGTLVRLVFAAIVGIIAIVLSRPMYSDQNDIMHRFAIVIVALFLLSPAQFPWYGTWVIILLPFYPLYGLLIMTVTLPLYYLSFHFSALGNYQLFNDRVLWLIWIPIWFGLSIDAWKIWRSPLVWQSDA